MTTDEFDAIADLGDARHEHDEHAVPFENRGDVRDAQVRGGHVEDGVRQERVGVGCRGSFYKGG